ncbi:MAG TPA: hypothetical protein VFJ64_07835 [Solirubrobacterales bacterium]|nr:hypothetical protein [Solirubrobacterales bacterium]
MVVAGGQFDFDPALRLEGFFGRSGQFDFGQRVFRDEALAGFLQRQVDRLFAFAAEVALDRDGGFDKRAFAFSRRDPSPVGAEGFFDFQFAEEARWVGVQFFELLGKGFKEQALGFTGREGDVGGLGGFALAFGFGAQEPFGVFAFFAFDFGEIGGRQFFGGRFFGTLGWGGRNKRRRRGSEEKEAEGREPAHTANQRFPERLRERDAPPCQFPPAFRDPVDLTSVRREPITQRAF